MAYSSKFTEEVLKKKKKESSYIESVLNGTYKSELPTVSVRNNNNIAPVKEEKDEKKWYQKILQKADAFDDNDSFLDNVGDTLGTIGGTIADAGMGVVKGIAGIGESIGTGISAGVAQVADWTGNDDYAEDVRKRIANKEGLIITQGLSKGQEAIDSHSVIGDTGDKLTEGAGYLAGVWALGGAGGKVAGALGKSASGVGKATQLTRDAVIFGSSAGSTFQESYSKEDVDDWQAWTKAIGSGYLSTKIEKIGGIFGKGSVDTKVANAISEKLLSGAGKLATRVGVAGGSEALEEFLEYAGNQLLDMGIDFTNLTTSKNDARYYENWNWEEVGENMFAGFVLGSGAKGVQLSSDVSNNMKSNNMNLKEAINETARVEDAKGQLEVLEDEKASLEEELGSKKLTQEDISEIFDEMQQADTKIKELEGKTAPIQAQVKEEVVQPNAQQITEQQELDLQDNTESVQKSTETVQNISKNEQNALENEKTSQKIAENVQKTPVQATTPTQQEISNLLDIQKNKSGSEYARAFYDLKRKYGDANLYKALNEENSKRKGITPQAQETIDNGILDEKSKKTLENFKKSGTKILDVVPNGWIKTEGATTAPKGYSWYNNGKSMFGGERETALVKDYNQETPIQNTQSIVNNDNAFSIAPTSQDIVEQQRQHIMDNVVNEEAPIHSGLTTDERQELDVYEDFISENGVNALDEASKKRYDYLIQQQELDTTPEAEDKAPVKDPLEDRDIAKVGDRKVKSYQEEHPEVKPYFKKEAEIMLQDLAERQEGKRYPIMGKDGYVDHWTGQQRVLAEDLANFKDEYGYKYSQIEEGLEKLIKGEENAVSKKLEFLINDRLSKGYTAVDGTSIPADQEYTELLREKEWSDLNSKNAKTISDEDIAPEQIKEEISNVIQEQVKDIKTELKTLKKQIKEVQAPIKEVAKELKDIKFDLTEEQNAKIQELRDDTKKWAEIYRERYDDKKFAEKRIKGVAMQNSAEIRDITQGDWLIPIEGGLTETELANKISKLRSNYVGKEVSVEGKQGKIIGNSFGKIGVEFTDGTKQYVEKNSIQPLEDIDSIIQEQQKMYDQYNIAPEPQKQVIEEQKTEVQEIAPSTENVAQNENTDVPETKQRSWVKTSTESEVVKDKIDIADLENVTYEVKSNKKTLDKANSKLSQNGYEASLDYFNSKLMDQKVSVEDIVLGERLIQEALNKGDKKTASELIENVAILGTELGQKIQALSIIQKLTPEGQLKVLEKVVNRGKTKGDKSFENVQLTQEMKDKILSVRNPDGTYDQTALNEVMEQVKQEVADQMKTTLGEKLNAWRYLAMLGNPKTHIRNLISNVAMKGTTAVKNAMARTIEDLAPIKNKTKTWEKPSKEILSYADKTTLEVKEILNGENSFSEDTSIKSKRRMFETEILEKVYKFNSDMLTKEDWWFKKPAFKNSFAEYLTANGIKTMDDIRNNYKIVEKAKLYAMEQAQIATFSQMSYLANKINEIENKNMAGKIIVGSAMPFKKTPINIAKAGLSYSPLGFTKVLAHDIPKVKKGEMEASQLIDDIAKSTTGSALVLIGYMLAQAGMLNGGGEDDKEGKYDSQLGDMVYSIKIGDTSYSLSWLSPVAMPLFVGANAHEILVEQEEWNTDVVINTLAQTLDPLSEMSFLSGLTGVLSSYETGSMEQIKGMAESIGQNYLTQFIPTLSSQVAGTLDDTKRTTTETNASGSKFINTTVNKLKYKIPGLRQTLEPSIDLWGNEVKQADSIGQRAIDNFIAPYSKKKDITTEVDTELKSIYRETGENSVLPTSSISSNLDYKNEKYKMTNKEYTDFKKKYGQTAYEMLEELFETDTYAESDSTEKAKLISNVYEYARDVSKKNYFDKHNVEYTNTTEDNIPVYKEKSIKNAIEYDMTPDEYSYYEENPSKYKTIRAITDYETYKTISKDLYDLKGDKDRNGKTISNSRKAKVYDYINDLDLGYEQKLILAKMEYPSEDQYNGEIIEYLNNDSSIDYDTMEEILLELGFKVDSYGNISW